MNAAFHYFDHALEGYNNSWWPEMTGRVFTDVMRSRSANTNKIAYDYPGDLGKVIDPAEYNAEIYDLAYVALGLKCEVKPAKHTFALLSDTWHGLEESWIEDSKPDLLLFLNNNYPERIVSLVESYGGRCLRSNYCVEPRPFNERPVNFIGALGAFGSTYPARTALMHALDSKPELKAVTATTYGKLPEAEYDDVINNSLFCVTGPVFDKWPIMKYYQSLASSSCLVTPDVPEVRAAGFTEDICIFVPWDGRYIGWMPDFEYLARSGQADKIRRAGWEFVRKKHCPEAMLSTILKEFQLDAI